MKRNWKLIVCLLAALFALTACSSKPDPEDFPDIVQSIGPGGTSAAAPSQPTDAPQTNEGVAGSTAPGGDSIFADNPYLEDQTFTEEDVLAEEDYIDPEYGVLDSFATDEPVGTVYPYAGSTPIPLNPVDMPTPTPKPDLTFTYAQYIASTVGVTFDGPAGWQVNESQSSVFVLSEPTTQIKDGQQCIITISAEPIGSNYSQRELETHVEYRLDTIGGAQFTDFKPSYTATRHMLGSSGVYANYSGRLTDGTEVGGRIQYVSIDGTLYGLEIVFPEGFRGDFIDLFGEIRSSMGFIR